MNRLRRRPLSYGPYALGRFGLVRRSYGAARGMLQRLGLEKWNQSGPPLVQGIDVRAAVASLREQSFYVVPQLPDEIVSEIRRFATEGLCRRQERPPFFKASDVIDGKLPTGEVAVLADVVGAASNQTIQAVSNERSVVAVIAKYLGYVPTGHHVRLIWSFACDATDEVRLNEGQTVLYHFDVHSYNFAYANYYITDVDARSGAHTMIVGSHTDKPLAWLFGSAMRSDGEIRGHYISDREITLTGPAGFGFIQDSSCYHRALAPVDRARLMLQIRYF